MEIQEIKDINPYLKLLLLADPSKEKVLNYSAKGHCFAGYENGQIIGVFVFTKISDICLELMNIAVAPEKQQKGFGKTLLEKALEKAKKLGAKEVILGTGNSSIDQLAFYQKSGFRINGIIKDYFINNYPKPIYENGIQCIDMIRLSKKLD